MEIRPKNNTTINYILVTDQFPIRSTFFPPKEFENIVIEFLRMAPYDLLELTDSVDFLEMCLRSTYSYGVDFSIFYTSSKQRLIEHVNQTNQIKLVFLDHGSETHPDIYRELKDNKRCFFHFRNLKSPIGPNPNIIDSPMDFIRQIIERQAFIFEVSEITPFNINPSVSLEYKGFNLFSYFVPTRNNYFLLNRIIGNFLGSVQESTTDVDAKIENETKKAVEKKYSFERQNTYLKQIRKIDFFQKVSLHTGIVKLVTNVEPKVAPLILVLPFNNPDVKNLHHDKLFADLVQSEQTQNYISEPTAKIPLEVSIMAGRILSERTRYLDNVAYLHSSFTWSPVVRLPVQGKSIYRELSFFRTLSFASLSYPKNRKKLRQSLLQFGRKLSEKTLSPELKELIKKRDGQIIAITDLPIEWITIDNIPLIFTHDVCRLPETSLHGLMSLHAANKMFKFSISEKTISKTLVILGNDEESFRPWHTQVYASSERHGFLIRKCLNLAEVKEAVQSVSPEILIFDCHGGVDEDTKTTYLKIGNEILDGHFIIENEIHAPIVFISACGTAPTYGTYNIVANAFFEAGAISVTSTYLPISINSGSFLYLRILEKLPMAIANSIHKNWLEFICHIIRTSTMNETYMNLLHKYQITQEEFFKSNTGALMDSLVFSKRRKLYTTLDEHIQKLTSDKKLHYSETIPEFLLYSNLGRGDLILFKIWEQEFLKKNVGGQKA